MAKTLEQYVAEATQAYAPATQAVQTQLDALQGQLDTANEQINSNYARQQAGLNTARNQAAESASMQAAGSGGSFGGQANIANRKYYEQSFVPAVTQLQTNQANDLAAAKQENDNRRTSLNSQLSNLQAQANQAALAQYYADLEAERQRQHQIELQKMQAAAQRSAAAAANAGQSAYYNYLMKAAQAGNNGGKTYKNWDFGNGYSLQQMEDGTAGYYRGSTPISAGQFLEATGGRGVNWDLWKDVWNNGVSTVGVGSDTVNAFNMRTPTSSNYNYLWS